MTDLQAIKEIQELERKLQVAIKALKEIEISYESWESFIATKALWEIE